MQHTVFTCFLWLQAPISIDKLRDYIAYARSNCHPELCAEAATDIVDGYMHMRRMGSSRKVCLVQMLLEMPVGKIHLKTPPWGQVLS